MVTATLVPTGAPPTNVPRKHVAAEYACSVSDWFAAPFTRPITDALVPPVANTRIRLGASGGGTATAYKICSVLVNVTRCGLANLSTKVSAPPLGSNVPAAKGLTYGFPSAVWPA